MLIECALAIISLCAVGYIWSRYADGTTVVPTAVFATGISEMTTSLSRLLKSISKGTSLLIDIREELSLLENYFTIQSYRYGGTITMDIQVDNESLYNSEIIKFTLQPLVENAVRHGVTKREEGGTIAVYTRENLREYTVSIWDDGVGFDPQQPHTDGREHVGIENVRSRLAAQCGGTLTVESQVGRGTVAVVRIPKPGRHKGREETRACESLQQMTRP